MKVEQSTPEIIAAEAKVFELHHQLHHQLAKEIEAAIQRGDSKEVRRLRDSRDDLASDLHAAKVAHKELEITHAEDMDAACGAEATRLSNAANAKNKERDAVAAEAEAINQAAARMAEHMQRFRSRGYTAIQELAEAQETETIRLRALARQA